MLVCVGGIWALHDVKQFSSSETRPLAGLCSAQEVQSSDSTQPITESPGLLPVAGPPTTSCWLVGCFHVDWLFSLISWMCWLFFSWMFGLFLNEVSDNIIHFLYSFQLLF